MQVKNIKLQTIIPEELAGKRLDQAVSIIYPEYSRSRIQNWIKTQQLTCNGQHCRTRDLVSNQDVINIQAQIEQQGNWQAQDIKLNVVYEDPDIIIINKPAGLVVHPGAGNPDNTLVNALLYHAPELSQLPRAGIIHRLDKNTSGLLIVARSLTAHTKLVKQLQQRTISREYETIVNGVVIAGATINAAINRHPQQRTKMAVVDSGKPAITHYRVIKRYAAHSHLRIKLETGRTHQIRVHMSHIKFPILGDPDYGKASVLQPYKNNLKLQQALQHFNRQALHASSLTLTHPTSQQNVQWHAKIPDDMANVLNLLEQNHA